MFLTAVYLGKDLLNVLLKRTVLTLPVLFSALHNLICSAQLQYAETR